MIPLIVASEYVKDAWTDPWGKPQWGNVVVDFAIGLEKTDMAPGKHDYGYGPGSIVDCHVWRAVDEDRLFMGIPSMDYCAGTRFLEIVDVVNGSYELRRPSFSRPVGQYILDGEPWDYAAVEALAKGTDKL